MFSITFIFSQPTVAPFPFQIDINFESIKQRGFFEFHSFIHFLLKTLPLLFVLRRTGVALLLPTPGFAPATDGLLRIRQEIEPKKHKQNK
jgi:hypothetical protein